MRSHPSEIERERAHGNALSPLGDRARKCGAAQRVPARSRPNGSTNDLSALLCSAEVRNVAEGVVSSGHVSSLSMEQRAAAETDNSPPSPWSVSNHDAAGAGDGPFSGGSGGRDDGGPPNASAAVTRDAALGLTTETMADSVSSADPNSQATGPPTRAESSPEVSPIGELNAEGENGVVVGLHSLDAGGRQDFAVPVEALPMQDEWLSLGGSAAVVAVGVLAAAAPDGRNGGRREEVSAAMRVEGAGQWQRQGPGPGPGQADLGGGEFVTFAQNRTEDAQQEEELAVTVGGPDSHGDKRPRDEAAQQLEACSSQERNSHEGVDDSFVCPICMESWTNSGVHRICALACGHLFGESCIKRWIRQSGRKASRCPQCNKRAKLEDVRTLYVPRTLAVVDGEAQQFAQELRVLRAEILRLKSEKEKLLQEVLQSKGRHELVQASLSQSLADNAAAIDFMYATESHNITTGSQENLGRSSLFGHSSGQGFHSRSRSVVYSGRQDQQHTGGGSNGYGRVSESGPNLSRGRAGGFDSCGGSFQLQHEVPVHGGKVFDMDAESLTVVFSNKTVGSGFGLSKMSLLSSREIDSIDFPPGLGTIRDVRLSPSGIGGTGKCAVVASTGKKLSLISLDSNNIVLSYSVQSPPWSCAWDPNDPNLFYSGLQNGCLLLVDLHQTSSPVTTLQGPSSRPIHTLQVVQGHSSVQANMGSRALGGREILSASSSGVSLWNVGSSVARSESDLPQCVFSDRELVCISLVYDCSVNAAVASVRRPPSAQTELSSSSSHGPSAGHNLSQPTDGLLNSRPPSSSIGCEKPSHWIFSRSQGSTCAEMNVRSRTAESKLPWETTGAIGGNKSKNLMTRTAIVSKSTPRSKSLFACGDDGTNSVWLWDMESCRLADTLAHQSPILGVKNVQIQGNDMLGCVSEGTLQIYRRV